MEGKKQLGGIKNFRDNNKNKKKKIHGAVFLVLHFLRVRLTDIVHQHTNFLEQNKCLTKFSLLLRVIMAIEKINRESWKLEKKFFSSQGFKFPGPRRCGTLVGVALQFSCGRQMNRCRREVDVTFEKGNGRLLVLTTSKLGSFLSLETKVLVVNFGTAA